MTITTLTAFLSLHSAPGAVPAKELASAIMHEAVQQDVNPKLIAQVIMQESRGLEAAMNKRTHDYGLMQINERTAESMHISVTCLFSWRCNLKQGVRILSKARRPCHYNTGATGALRWPLKCLSYETKLASFQ